MTWVAIGVGVFGTVVGAATSADASRKASNAQSKANGQSLDEQRRQFEIQREDNKYFMEMQQQFEAEMADWNRAYEEDLYNRNLAFNKGAIGRGEAAGNQLQYLLGLGDGGVGEKGFLTRRFTEADMTKDGGYDFRMGEGQKGVGNQLAASGNLLSGAAMKALTRFNQDFASNEYNNAYGRFTNDQNSLYNRLSDTQGAGQNAVNSVAGIGGNAMRSPSNTITTFAGMNAQNNANYGNAMNQYQQNQGNINANLAMARGNAMNQGITGLTNAWNTYQARNNNSSNSYGGGFGTGNTYGNQDYGSYF